MSPDELARIISEHLDDGDNDMLDGIAGIEKVARAIAEEMDIPTRQRFLKLIDLDQE